MLEAQFFQSPIGRAYIRTLIKRAAAAVHDYRVVVRNIANHGLELVDTLRL